MSLTISYLVFFVGIFVAATLLGLAVRFARVDKHESKKSAARVASSRDALLGRTRTQDDWLPDARVKRGMIYNEKENRIEINGRLSDDSLDRIFR